MKNLFLFGVCLLAISCSIKKQKQYQATGIVYGRDTGNCACCKGFMLHINGSDTSFRFLSFPKGSNVDTLHFPVAVKFNYLDTGRCGSNHIVAFQSVEQAN